MQENDRVADADVDVTHLDVDNADTPPRVRVSRFDLSCSHLCDPNEK